MKPTDEAQLAYKKRSALLLGVLIVVWMCISAQH